MSATVLVVGAAGQLGHELLRTAPDDVRVVPADRRRVDITVRDAVLALVEETRPAVVINAAGWTAVNCAETEEAAARAVNVGGAAHLAEAAGGVGARLIHVSTDFVFDGSHGRPWRPEDPTGPLNAYGRSKRDGELLVLDILGPRALVLRTAWLHSAHGTNFVKTMLGLMRERDELRVVADQVGTPTWARSLAGAVWAAVERPSVSGVHHWSDAGVASWYDFAVAIQEEALVRGLIAREVPVRPVRSEEFPTPARRPAYSVLDCGATIAALGVAPAHWRVNLRRMLDELPHD